MDFRGFGAREYVVRTDSPSIGFFFIHFCVGRNDVSPSMKHVSEDWCERHMNVKKKTHPFNHLARKKKGKPH